MPGKKKNVINLPEDCEKLSLSACTDKKTKNQCKIKYGPFGFNNKCVKNEDRDLEKYIFEKGFEEFSKIDPDNLEEELRLRNKICKNLDPARGGTCQSELGRKLGCKVVKRFTSPNTCELDPKLIRFLKKREMLCEKEDCEELKKKGVLCRKCIDELKELLQKFNGLYTTLSKVKNSPPERIKEFNETYEDIIDDWSAYFVTGQKKKLDEIEQKKMKIDSIHGGVRCQAINISGCDGKGNYQSQCRCKGFRDEYGIFCANHRRCYIAREKKFDEFRNKFEELCKEKEVCQGLVSKMKEFYEMIKYSTYGKSKTKKIEVDNIIDIAKEYMKYYE